MRSLVNDTRLRPYEQLMKQPVAVISKPTKTWKTREIEAGPLSVTTHAFHCGALYSTECSCTAVTQ